MSDPQNPDPEALSAAESPTLISRGGGTMMRDYDPHWQMLTEHLGNAFALSEANQQLDDLLAKLNDVVLDGKPGVLDDVLPVQPDYAAGELGPDDIVRDDAADADTPDDAEHADAADDDDDADHNTMGLSAADVMYRWRNGTPAERAKIDRDLARQRREQEAWQAYMGVRCGQPWWPR